jgi:hypothetical protein
MTLRNSRDDLLPAQLVRTFSFRFRNNGLRLSRVVTPWEANVSWRPKRGSGARWEFTA